jgi:hypothetical protein
LDTLLDGWLDGTELHDMVMHEGGARPPTPMCADDAACLGGGAPGRGVDDYFGAQLEGLCEPLGSQSPTAMAPQLLHVCSPPPNIRCGLDFPGCEGDEGDYDDVFVKPLALSGSQVYTVSLPTFLQGIDWGGVGACEGDTDPRRRAQSLAFCTPVPPTRKPKVWSAGSPHAQRRAALYVGMCEKAAASRQCANPVTSSLGVEWDAASEGTDSTCGPHDEGDSQPFGWSQDGGASPCSTAGGGSVGSSLDAYAYAYDNSSPVPVRAVKRSLFAPPSASADAAASHPQTQSRVRPRKRARSYSPPLDRYSKLLATLSPQGHEALRYFEGADSSDTANACVPCDANTPEMRLRVASAVTDVVLPHPNAPLDANTMAVPCLVANRLRCSGARDHATSNLLVTCNRIDRKAIEVVYSFVSPCGVGAGGNPKRRHIIECPRGCMDSLGKPTIASECCFPYVTSVCGTPKCVQPLHLVPSSMWSTSS